jgi:hypothetical protein
MEKIIWTDRVRRGDALPRVNGESYIFQNTIRFTEFITFSIRTAFQVRHAREDIRDRKTRQNM